MSTTLTTALATIALLLATSTAFAQTPATAQLDVMAELRLLRVELDAARKELLQLRTDLDQLKTPAGATAPELAALPGAVEMLQTQVAEQAQTKVESASRLPVKIFGTIQSNISSNSGEANWLENPNIVAAQPPVPAGSFASTMRQTRLGVRADGLALGPWQASGALVFDFFGGMPSFQTGQAMGLPRLLYAFTRFERGGTALMVGQDDMTLAPRNPTSIAAYSFPLLFRSGNLYLRAPQARIESRLAGSDSGELRATVGILAPIGGDVQNPDYTFVPPALGGERSRRPGVQARLAWQKGDNDRGASLGVSGHYSKERPQTELLTSWAGAVDFHLQGTRVGIAGEAFTGDNLDAFGGALGQVARGSGGFLEGRLRPLDRWEVVVGAGTDRPRDTVLLSRNQSAYGSLTFRVTPEVASSFEYRWLETTAASVKRRNRHLNWALTYSF